ncbi:MAG: DUF547 domain-containing protein [Salinivenus sp.]
MSDAASRRYRQYAGLSIVLVAYLGGIVGWSWAAFSAMDESAPADSSQAQETVIQTTATAEASPDPEGKGHDAFDRLLARYVDSTGAVDYAALKQNQEEALRPYLRQLASADLSDRSDDERLALWINAYNALTLKLIVDHYPVENIWAITPGPAEPKDDSPFQLEVGTVADTVRTLDEIEHEIIRERFEEPRIHFALVCAADSCPELRREAYTGSRLNDQLDAQGHAFLHDPAKNQIPADEDRIALSRILKWYGEDFGPTPEAIQRALAPYFEGTVGERLAKGDYAVEFRPYDWALNDQGNPPASASSEPASDGSP